MGAFFSALVAGLTYAKVGLALLQLAQRFIDRADRKELEDAGYNAAVDAATIEMYKRLGRTDIILSQGAQLTPEDKRKVLKED